MMRRRLLAIDNCPYIRQGLVVWFDGFRRGGISGQWKDLISGIVSTMYGTYTELEDGITFPATEPYGYGIIDSSINISDLTGTVEFAGRLSTIENTGRPVFSNFENLICCSIASRNQYTPFGMTIRYGHDPTNAPAYIATTSGRFITASANDTNGMINGIICQKYAYSGWNANSNDAMFPGREEGNPMKGRINSLRIYNRKLSTDEMLYNQKIDNERFSLRLNI